MTYDVVLPPILATSTCSNPSIKQYLIIIQLLSVLQVHRGRQHMFHKAVLCAKNMCV